MVDPATMDHVHVCQDEEQLYAFALGTLPAADLERIAEHLAGCSSCETRLLALEVDDPLVSRLRNCPQPLPVFAEPEYAEMERRALQIPLTGREVSTGAYGPEGDGADADTDIEPRSPAFGVYRLIEKLGHGGMGVVYKAWHQPLKRHVAVKMIRAGALAGPEEIARFRVEGEAAARLRHPNVIQVYDLGEHDGQPYFSMELLEGGSLAKRLAGQPLPPRQAAELAQTLARAVQAAHEQQIIHRDLKPSNILLAADGTPKIGDFGLAKLLDSDQDQTHSDALLGTTSYMSPEQARGARHVGPLADVYALGAILYELLTGQPPFRAETRQATLDLVRTQDPVPPSQRQKKVPRDLEAICLKCLEKDPSRRYASAGALADDLARWLRGELPLARPAGWLTRSLRWVRRHPALTTLVILILAGIPTGVGVAIIRDPDRPARQIEGRLTRKEKVVLIGETGAPAWSRWRLGADSGKVSLSPDQTFTVHCWQPGLLELVRDPQMTRYRIQAEVLHRKSISTGRVGIYFADRVYPVGADQLHVFGEVCFNDLYDKKDVWNRLSPTIRIKPPAPKGNSVHMVIRFCSEGKGGFTCDQDAIDASRELFQPTLLRVEKWRRLTVDVTPEGISAFWLGEPDEDEKPIWELPAEQWAKRIETSLDSLLQRTPNAPPSLRMIPTSLPVQGALGLYLYQSSGSFRNVTIEALEDP